VSNLIDSESGLPLPESVRGEAAVWLSRLHSDERTERTEAAFRRWLAASPLNRVAFERMTAAWEITGGLRRAPSSGHSQVTEFGFALRRVLIASTATLAICALITVAAFYVMRLNADAKAETFATVFGERRAVSLSDGSQLQLNTDSQVKVSYDAHLRRVTLEKGQARFQVAANPSRPFVVRVGERQVVALGTTFDVRWTDGRLAIVLVEGRAAILPAGDSYTAATALGTIVLGPGERLEFASPTFAVKSTVRLDREEAWVKGRVVFDATRLGAAIAEINRYAPRRLKLVNPALADLLISGTFSVDDPNAFARAVAQMFSLQVIEASDAVLIGSSSR
jgi:transmembrane sensor